MTNLTRRLLTIIILFNLSTSSQTSVFRIVDFPAVGDGKNVKPVSIQKAIYSCARTAEGTVYVPAGVFLTCTFQVRSHVSFHLESGASLKGSEELEDYYLNGKLADLIFTQDAENVAISGLGTSSPVTANIGSHPRIARFELYP